MYGRQAGAVGYNESPGFDGASIYQLIDPRHWNKLLSDVRTDVASSLR